MKHTDNLVNRQFGVPQFVSLLNNAEKQNRERYEEALYSVYFGDDEEMAFKKAVSCFGGKYPLIAFLFFIKDRDRFCFLYLYIFFVNIKCEVLNVFVKGV